MSLEAATPAPPPLAIAEFDAALGALAGFEAPPFLAVAVSGGPDSLALAILADRWARRRGGEICAVSVDHQLRPQSADEMRLLSGWLRAREIRHEVLVWSGAKPATGIQEAARRARYRLLDEWCREQGCLHLLTAHHREDQAETHLIRRRADSGPVGLAAMSTVRELADCRLLRPLLGIAKARLTAFLDAEGQPFVDDPSNRDPAFERARLRAGGKAASDLADPGAVLAATRRFGRRRIVFQRDRDAVLARAVSLHRAGFAVLDPAPLLYAPREVGLAALAALVAAIGGGAYPAGRERLARLYRMLDHRAAGAAPRGHTLGGCRFVRWRHRVLVWREPAAAEGPVQLRPGETREWDRRFTLHLPAGAAAPVTIGCLGRAGIAELDLLMPQLRRAGLPRLLHPIVPAVWNAAGLAAVPDLGYAPGPAASLPRLVLRPVNCLTCGDFAVV